MEEPSLYEHYRPTGGTTAPGVYRVVGTGEDVTLLRVTDAEGSRIHSGRVDTVSRRRLESEFTRAEDPDGSDRLPRALSGVGVGFVVVAGLSWLGILTTPAPPATLAAIGLVLLVAGRVVDRFDPFGFRR